ADRGGGRKGSWLARPFHEQEAMPRRPLRLADLDAALGDAEQLLAAGYDRAGSWSLAQVCDHLARVLTLSLDGFPSRMPWAVRLLARWLYLRRFLPHEVIRRRFPPPDYLQPADPPHD